MEPRNTTEESGRAAAKDLRAVMRGRVVQPGDEAYDNVRRTWNGAVDHRPALVAICQSTEDVQAAVRAARAHRLPLSVRGGGHSWLGRGIRHDGLVIDLTEMHRVTVDAASRVANIAGGVTAGDLIAAVSPHRLAAVTGTISAVGMAGLSLAGGYGPLSPRYGLALDNLLGAEIVLADGRLVTADEAENPDLFWALRGGGGNFGVVTAMRIRLHPLDSLLAGLILFPISEAASVLHRYAELLASAPDELELMAAILPGPDGRPVLGLAPAWTGDPVVGEETMARVCRLGTPLLAQIAPMTYAQLIARFDTQVVNGNHYEVRTRSLPRMTPEAIAALVEAAQSRTSPLSSILIQDFRGAATRVATDATAFDPRSDHFLIVIVAAWEPGSKDDGARHRRWAQDTSRALAPVALPGGYTNLLGPDDSDQIAQAYGRNADRLRDVKRRYDPDRIFSATPLPLDGGV